MDVHHHSHTVPIAIGRKKWTHYLWEFLMLFLAVTLGFFVENQREHYVEHQREKQFMISLLQDLKNDTTALSQNIWDWKWIQNKIDSLRTFVEPPFQSINTEMAYYHATFMYAFSEFNYNDRTIEQLRNAGNFRLIRKRDIVNNLVNYDNSIRNQLRNQEAVTRNEFMAVLSQQSDLFNSKHIDEYVKKLYTPANLPAKQLYKVEDKPELLFRYYNELYKYRFLAMVLINENTELKNQAINLIKLVKQEYHFE